MSLARVLAGCCAVLFAAVLAGCGKSEPTATTTPKNKEALEDLNRLLLAAEGKKQKPPARLAALDPVHTLFPAAYDALLRGEIIYQWGAGLNPSAPDTLLAYETRFEMGDGGWVLFQDGTIKELSAAEFKNAPKAVK